MAKTTKAGYVILGNSAGGIGAIEAIRSVDKKTPITVVSDESYPSYSRPLISNYLAGEKTLEEMLFRSADFYETNNVTAVLGKAAEKIDLEKGTVTIEGGKSIAWSKLLIATGGTPIVPPMKGLEGPGAFTFTTLDDAKAAKDFIKPGMKAVVIGGGLIGISVTEALTKIGVEVNVVEMKDRVLNTLLDDKASAIALEALVANDVNVVTGRTVKEINRGKENNHITSVTLDNGCGIDCDLVIVAIGVRPRMELAEKAGLKTNRGILVDLKMKTSHRAVYACGDVVEAYDFVTGEKRVIPIWPSAYIGGRVAGFNMAGVASTYAGGTPMNSTKYFGLAISSAGMYEAPDDKHETIVEEAEGYYHKLVLDKKGIITGIIFSGSIEPSGIVYGLMKDKVDVSAFKEMLVKVDMSFMSLPEELWRERLSTAFVQKPEEDSVVSGGASK